MAKPRADELVFVPLGGVGEIGMNMGAYGFGPERSRKWLVVDCGVTFAGPQLPGIELIMADPTFLEENADKLKGVTISGVAPTYATISDFSYPGARPLYIYIKKAHLGPIKGLKEYIAEWAKAWGPDRYLKAKGMVISPDAVRAASADTLSKLTVMDGTGLK